MHIISIYELIDRYNSGEEFVIFDTETTGLSVENDEIIEIAGIIWKEGWNPSIKTFNRTIKVDTNKINPHAWRVHKIPKRTIENSRNAKEVLSDFIEFCDNRMLIAHNIKFDFPMLNNNLIKNGLETYRNDDTFCTLEHARNEGVPGKLEDLFKHYEIKNWEYKGHHAINDAWTLLKIIDRIIKNYKE